MRPVLALQLHLSRPLKVISRWLEAIASAFIQIAQRKTSFGYFQIARLKTEFGYFLIDMLKTEHISLPSTGPTG
jgi:hypothetical protein